MKKNTSKSLKTTASVAPAAKAPAAAKASAKKSVGAGPSASKALVPAVKPPKSETVVPTTIIAQVDIGFGNSLYVRGEGGGLSWDKGLVMENAGADQWRITLSKVTAPVPFKLLVNDITWSVGEDFVVVPGSTVSLMPTFA